MKKVTRSEIINSMCMTSRHDYGIDRKEEKFSEGSFFSLTGMTEEERKFLHREMSQIFDNDIMPFIDKRKVDLTQ